jgi:hypothetical protein
VKLLFEKILRETEEDNNDNADNFTMQQACDAYEKNQRFIGESGNIIDQTDTLGKHFNTGPTKPLPSNPIKKPFQAYLDDAMKQQGNN